MTEIGLDALVGKTITRIRWNEYYLLFDTAYGGFGFVVHGECCSESYFHDFYGVAHLLNNGPVISTRKINLPEDEKSDRDSHVQCYGYELVTKHPIWGDVTSVFSFRNASNGCYGGWMSPCTSVPKEQLKNVDVDQTGD